MVDISESIPIISMTQDGAIMKYHTPSGQGAMSPTFLRLHDEYEKGTRTLIKAYINDDLTYGTEQFTVDTYKMYVNSTPVGSPSDWGKRATGQDKWLGWCGVIQLSDGSIMSEAGVGIEIDGVEVECPLIVPTSTYAEIIEIAKFVSLEDYDLPESIFDKAAAWARSRIAEGKDPFYNDEQGDTDGSRPIKSSISPFVYIDALDNGSGTQDDPYKCLNCAIFKATTLYHKYKSCCDYPSIEIIAVGTVDFPLVNVPVSYLNLYYGEGCSYVPPMDIGLIEFNYWVVINGANAVFTYNNRPFLDAGNRFAQFYFINCSISTNSDSFYEYGYFLSNIPWYVSSSSTGAWWTIFNVCTLSANIGDEPNRPGGTGVQLRSWFGGMAGSQIISCSISSTKFVGTLASCEICLGTLITCSDIVYQYRERRVLAAPVVCHTDLSIQVFNQSYLTCVDQPTNIVPDVYIVIDTNVTVVSIHSSEDASRGVSTIVGYDGWFQYKNCKFKCTLNTYNEDVSVNGFGTYNSNGTVRTFNLDTCRVEVNIVSKGLPPIINRSCDVGCYVQPGYVVNCTAVCTFSFAPNSFMYISIYGYALHGYPITPVASKCSFNSTVTIPVGYDGDINVCGFRRVLPYPVSIYECTSTPCYYVDSGEEIPCSEECIL